MPNSVDAWVLMALIHRDIDDFDYKNALLLSERLYGIDKSNEDYQFLYAKCLYLNNDCNGSYSVLAHSTSVPCLNLFARSCLDLGNQQSSVERQGLLWREGAKALTKALEQSPPVDPHCWGDDLASVTTRNHVPSRASMCNMLGELYTKLENIRAAATYLWKSLDSNPFKLTSYTRLCNISPDIVDFDTAALPKDIFKDFPLTTHIGRSHHTTRLPDLPNPAHIGISTSDTDRPLPPLDKVNPYMPSLRGDYLDVSLDQLRSLVYFTPNQPKDSPDASLPQRSQIEKDKDKHIAWIKDDIEKMKADQAYKNKHGLHKKPPVEKPQEFMVELMDVDTDDFGSTTNTPLRSISQTSAARVDLVMADKTESGNFSASEKMTSSKAQARKGRKRSGDVTEKPKASKQRIVSPANSLYHLFNITQDAVEQETPDEISKLEVLSAMNRVMSVIRTMANAYMYHSFYYCREAALELQKLDDRQYNTAWVLCVLGKAYYDMCDYQNARIFFRHSFYIAPWVCDGVPIYSTCLWYLEKKRELNLLAYKMNENKSHHYEAYIAIGNWTKCAKGGNEARKWFQKAVEYDPTRSYGHALLGYEEWEKGNYLGAKQHFANCMVANKRSYLGWYGMAVAYKDMEEYSQAKALLAEAVRLHPHHPVVLSTMAEVLLSREEFEDALEYARRSLNIRRTPTTEKLRQKIEKSMQGQDSLIGTTDIPF